MGAWIETEQQNGYTDKTNVAPYVGAWIETPATTRSSWQPTWSHPTWVRGLKLVAICSAIVAFLSHPTWVRGLKRSFDKVGSFLPAVAPYVGAWIETLRVFSLSISWFVAPYVGAWIETPVASSPVPKAVSHPTWVRGLKQYNRSDTSA